MFVKNPYSWLILVIFGSCLNLKSIELKKRIAHILTMPKPKKISESPKLYDKTKKLYNSEILIKELYEDYAPTITFLRMNEVSPSLANKLNVLFTPEIQQALKKSDRYFLKKKGFKFYKNFPNVFSHESLPEYILKIPRISSEVFSPVLNIDGKQNVFLNASRVWNAHWNRMVQNEFQIPLKKVFFMKSDFPELAIVVVAQKIKDFDKQQGKLYEDFTNKEKRADARLKSILTFDLHEHNLRGKYIVDTEARSSLVQFIEDPFYIFEDPLLKNRIRSRL